MALEVGTFIDDLVQTNPPSSDPVGQGDDHLRLLKAVLQATLPNMGSIMGQVRRQDTAATALRTWNTNQLVVSNSATATVVLTLPAASSITTGWSLSILTLVGAAVQVLPGAGGSISSSANFSIPEQAIARVFYEGSGQWRAVAAPAGGPRTVLDNLYVRGTSTLSGSVELLTTLRVAGEANFAGAMSISGALNVSSNFSTAGTLNAGGTATFQGGVTISGSAQLKTTLNVEGRSSFSGSVDMATTLRVGSDANFMRNVSISAALNVSGNLSCASTINANGGAVAFPASQIASANANTLDDYEEGTWTPSLGFSTLGNTAVVYTLRSGRYTKIGDTCYVVCNILTSAFTHTTASGDAQVTGLPFTAQTSAAGDIYPISIGYMTNVTGGTDTNGGIRTTENWVIFVSTNFSAGTSAVMSTGSFASGTNKTVNFAGTYKTA